MTRDSVTAGLASISGDRVAPVAAGTEVDIDHYGNSHVRPTVLVTAPQFFFILMPRTAVQCWK